MSINCRVYAQNVADAAFSGFHLGHIYSRAFRSTKSDLQSSGLIDFLHHLFKFQSFYLPQHFCRIDLPVRNIFIIHILREVPRDRLVPLTRKRIILSCLNCNMVLLWVDNRRAKFDISDVTSCIRKPADVEE